MTSQLLFTLYATLATAHDNMELLQRSQGQVAQSPEVNLSNIQPIYYVHLPKSGSSFATTVAHAGCGNAILRDFVVKEPRETDWEVCGGSTVFARFHSGHEPLKLEVDGSGAELRNVVMMFRSPKQRIISGFFDDLHDCFEMQQKYSIGLFRDRQPAVKVQIDVGNGELVDRPDLQASHQPDGFDNPERLMEYAQCVDRCAINMLNGIDCESREEADLETAREKVSKLGFVGLTEQWALTVCLWHARFGGPCLPAEFSNVRPGVSMEDGKYDESRFGDWSPADDVLYEAVQDRFWQDIHAHGVNPETCKAQYCKTLFTPLFDRVTMPEEPSLLGVLPRRYFGAAYDEN